MDLGLKGKKVIITGGTRGIGRAVVEQLLNSGAHVVTCARTPEQVAAFKQAMQAHLQASDQFFDANVCDVSNATTYIDWLNSAAGALKGVDGFVANVSAGAEQGDAGWKKTFDVDLMATVKGTEAVLAPMAQSGGGSIVILASIAALSSFGDPSPYGAIKAALISHSGQLAKAVGQYGIRVNSVSPGPIHVDDGFWGNIKRTAPQMYQQVCDAHPQKRLGTTQEVASAVSFLLSAAASWVSGTNLVVDGCMTDRVQF